MRYARAVAALLAMSPAAAVLGNEEPSSATNNGVRRGRAECVGHHDDRFGSEAAVGVSIGASRSSRL
jgi:hypothetical protein